MNYFPFHIGDYRSGTMHLTNDEDLAYRRALDWYYDTEKPIPLETQWVARRLRVETKDLETVLQDFFVRTDEGWVHERCDQEIAQFQQMQAKNRANGAKGGRPKKPKTTEQNPVGFQSVSDGQAVETNSKGNQEPRTNNQEPNTPLTPQGAAGGGQPPEDDLPELHELPPPAGGGSHPLAGTVCQLMKRLGIGLVNPSNSKLNALLNAGATAGQFEDAAQKALASGKTFSYALAIVEREEKEARELGIQLQKPKVTAPPAQQPKSFAQQDREEKARRWEEMTGERHPDAPGDDHSFQHNVIDITPVAPQRAQIGAAQ